MHMRTEVMTAALLFAGVAVFAQMPGRSGVAGYQRANTSRGTGALNASPKTTAVGLKPAVSAFNRIARTEEAAAKSRAPKTSPAQTKIGALGNRNYHTTSAEAKRDRLFNAPGRVNPTAKPGTSRTADKPGVGIIAPGAVSYTQSGDSVFGSNGTTYTRSGDTVFGSDGHTATRIGDTTFTSSGETYTQSGDTVFSSDGVSYTTIGDTVFGSNGSTYTRSGDTVFTGGRRPAKNPPPFVLP